MGVIVSRKVVVRSIMTEQLRDTARQDINEKMEEIDQRIQQIDFRTQPQISQMQKQNIQQAMAAKKQVEQEKKKLRDIREELLQKLQQLDEIEDGEEVVRGTLDSQVELHEGDNIDAKLGRQEIVTKDGAVREIRWRKESEEDSIKLDENVLLETSKG